MKKKMRVYTLMLFGRYNKYFKNTINNWAGQDQEITPLVLAYKLRLVYVFDSQPSISISKKPNWCDANMSTMEYARVLLVQSFDAINV